MTAGTLARTAQGNTREASRTARALTRLVCAVLFLSGTSYGWVYPEHREIMKRAIQRLAAEDSVALRALWAYARTGHESRLSVLPADTADEINPTTIDLAAWPAVAGDHSCSAADMLHNVLETDWILDVASVTARLSRDLSAAGLERHDRTNALRDSDLRLQRADPEYITRAGANNVHFLLARPNAETDQQSYVELCLASGVELNALGAYAWNHLSALRKAHRLSEGNLSESDRASFAQAALADEAFAIHFLQDVFAAGHVAGARGDASQRKGTHDYYNEYGLEARTWEGKSLILKGDAWMRPQDADRAAIAVRASLAQLLEASEGNGAFKAFMLDEPFTMSPDSMNTCLLDVMPSRDIEAGLGLLLTDIVRSTPVPGLSEGEGELPRFRAELGPFVGVVPALRFGFLNGGFGMGQEKGGITGGLEMAVRLGLGLDGVMNESGDGLVFLDLGARLDASSSMSVYEGELYQQFGNILAAIPSRGGIVTRIRIPFYLIPFDLLVAAPFLLPTSPDTYTQMATIAGNGGLIPWQAGLATSFGRFQLVLGREVGACFFGYLGASRILLPSGDPEDQNGVLANLESIQLDFPVVEYMPFRTFSSDQSSSLVIQVLGSVDIPTRVSDIYPEGSPTPEVHAVWTIGLRAAFRWRHYM
jgi:hypothetical protein